MSMRRSYAAVSAAAGDALLERESALRERTRYERRRQDEREDDPAKRGQL